jgi:histidinol phosphatase-like PHP family hydrolase/predicted MPP superfamily phosphohydrolase
MASPWFFAIPSKRVFRQSGPVPCVGSDWIGLIDQPWCLLSSCPRIVLEAAVSRVMVAGTMDTSLRLLVIADVHFVGVARHECAIPARRASLGLELVERVCGWAQRSHLQPDAVVLLGDLVDNGDADGAVQDLAAIRAVVEKLGVPVISIPGNHDGDRTQFESVFGGRAAAKEVNGVLLFPFVDAYDEQDRAERAEGDSMALMEAARANPGRPIIAIQHNPIHPPIESSYPYVLTNRDAAMGSFREAGVRLSLSGHYHRGQDPTEADGVLYATCPALCEAPFSFLVAHVGADEVGVERHSLTLAEEWDQGAKSSTHIEDYHCHTQFAYCASTVNVDGALERSRLFGVNRQNFTEHAGQLYLTADEFWKARWLEDPDMWIRARDAGKARMRDYRRFMNAYRSDSIGVGLEVDADGAGRLMVAEEDLEGLDVLVGAVHFVPEGASANPSAKQIAREFMQYTESLVRGGVNILAHPFRMFLWTRQPVPANLYGQVADLLAAHNCAAEVNLHGYDPDPEFYAQCMARGVKIALGSDSHALWEVGSFLPHFEVLRKAGASMGQLNEILLHGPQR